MSPERVRHPLFARAYTRFSRSMEREVGPYRAELLNDLEGRVLEVGAGNGMNFAHYGPAVTGVVALEPEPYLRERALEAAARATASIEVIDGNAHELPFEDGSFDAVVFSLVLCSIGDPSLAVTQARRVLAAGGELRFLEHVRSEHQSKARLQRLLDRSRLWPAMAGGCHCSRDTAGTIAAAGFEITGLRSMAIGPAWDHTNPHVLGRAVPAGR